jgi:hypothetical protein
MCHHRIWTELSHACNSHLSASMDYIFILTWTPERYASSAVVCGGKAPTATTAV